MNATPSGDIRAAADRCVKCGLCLPHCPTWQLHRREGDSPRGRVELISALAGGRMAADPTLRERLDGCLLCRACEAACPARVPFGSLMDWTRERWPVRTPGWSRLFRPGPGRGLLRLALWLASSLPVRALAGRRLAALLDLLPGRVVLRRRRLAPAGGPRIGLFTGCVSDAVDRATLNDAAVLLEASGARVAWVEGSGCCGALDRHQGDAGRADAHARGNAGRIDLQSLDGLVSVATGCSAEFMDYARLLGDAGGAAWTGRHRELMACLASRQASLSFEPLERTVLLHQPCSARHVLRDTRSAPGLLRKIPRLRVIESTGLGCCGAAGTAMFRTPRTARALAAGLVEEFRRSGAEILVTANIGCALHLRGALRAAGLDGAVKHPVNLLREQLRG